MRDDIEDAIDESASAEFTPQERAILKNVLALHDVRVADVMVPRADVVALALDTTLREALDPSGRPAIRDCRFMERRSTIPAA